MGLVVGIGGWDWGEGEGEGEGEGWGWRTSRCLSTRPARVVAGVCTTASAARYPSTCPAERRRQPLASG